MPDDSLYETTGPLVNAVALDLLGHARDEGRPYFLFVHYFDAHYNFTPPETTAGRWTADYRGAFSGRIDQWVYHREPVFHRFATGDEYAHLANLYDEDVLANDGEVAALLKALERRGLLANTVIVVMGDHGEEFGEHQRIMHGNTLYQEVVHVPLLFAGPGVPRGRRIEHPVSQTDIVPTLLPLLGLAPVSGLQGANLFAGPDRNRAVHSYLNLRQLRREAVLRGDWKLVAAPDGTAQLYNLAGDPGEQRDLAANHPAIVERLSDAQRRHAAACEARRNELNAEPLTSGSSPLAEEQLRAVGYLQ
jgi:arylsulfatase A-like enzyme